MFMADSVCHVFFENYIYTIESFQEKKIDTLGYNRATISSITWKICVRDMDSRYKNI